jgi:hypothetical protein
VRKSAGEMAKLSSSRKRKVSTISEVNTLGSVTSIGDYPPDAKKTGRSKVAHAEDDNEEQYVFAASPSQRKRSRKGEPTKEKRFRVFRKHAPQSYLERLDRVRSQRMFLIDRERKSSRDGSHEEEVFGIAGTTGNIYQVKIGKMPSCTCPDAKKGNQCKHIVYVSDFQHSWFRAVHAYQYTQILVNVLKAPEHLAYQLAFLSNELTTIFALAPSTPQSSPDGASTDSSPNNRKPIEGDCPVCVMEFEAEAEEIVWCKAACGNNIHKQCFEQWAASKPGQVKCVYCRTPWKGDEESFKRISKMGERNEEGYVNVASELGLSGQRDYSSYHQPWVRDRIYGGWS